MLITVSYLLRRVDCQRASVNEAPCKRTLASIYCQKDDAESALENDTEEREGEKLKKKEHPLKGRKKSALQRLKMSRSHTGKRHSAETRAKIRQSVRETLREQQQQQRLSPEPDMFTELQSEFENENRASGQSEQQEMEYFVMEKAVLELMQLRREVAVWLEAWYSRHERKPTLDEVAQLSPEVHNKFLRYIALQDFIRSNS